MANRQGFPIWYELITPDPDGATSFYGAIAGWTVEPAAPGGPDYRMLTAPDGPVGGMLKLDETMKAGGTSPRWLPYFCAEDVDATAARATSLGAGILVPPTDIPGVGRFAFLTDPQGAPFYTMRGDSEGESTSFAPHVPGHFAWNELSTTDGPAALSFYASLFGFENRETMDMGPMGGYHFLDLGPARLGALVEMTAKPATWRAYIRIADMATGAAAVTAHGGTIVQGLTPVPNGDVILIGTDPQGAEFALVGAGAAV